MLRSPVDSHLTSITMAGHECDRDEAALLREGQYTTDLSESTYYRLNARQLELQTAGGRTLIFSAERSR